MKSTTIAFTADDPGAAVAAIEPGGWINLRPDLDDLPPPSRGWLGHVFSNRGPAAPLATWHPGERAAGMEHGTGSKLGDRANVPAGWRVVQDHPRRGLVVQVPEGVADAEVVRWLVELGEELSPFTTAGRWTAQVLAP